MDFLLFSSISWLLQSSLEARNCSVLLFLYCSFSMELWMFSHIASVFLRWGWPLLPASNAFWHRYLNILVKIEDIKLIPKLLRWIRSTKVYSCNGLPHGLRTVLYHDFGFIESIISTDQLQPFGTSEQIQSIFQTKTVSDLEKVYLGVHRFDLCSAISQHACYFQVWSEVYIRGRKSMLLNRLPRNGQ